MKQSIIIICRHGKAYDSKNDLDRTLTQQGIDETESFKGYFAQILKEKNITLSTDNTLCLCSPSKRTKQTMELLNKELNLNIEIDENLYSINGSKKHFSYLENLIKEKLNQYEVILIMAHDETGSFFSWLTIGKGRDFDLEDPQYDLLNGNKNPYEYRSLSESTAFILDCNKIEFVGVTPDGIIKKEW